MKHIFYLLDGFSPLSLKREFSKIYEKKLKKKNFIDKLSERSVFFKNCYGYGETYSTVYSMINGKDIYENYCDAPEIHFSFKRHVSLLDFYKNKDFKTIYFRNAKSHYPINGFYKRFNESFAKRFDKYCLKKSSPSYNLKDFLLSNNFFKNYNNNNHNIFYFIHDMSFHDNKNVYDGNVRQHLKAFEKASKEVKKNLKLIKNNKFIDTIFFLSDHGLSTKPFNKIHTEKNLNKDKYENYYKNMFLDEKIKFLFFISSPSVTKQVITQFVEPTNVFKIIKEYNNSKFKTFVYKIKKKLNNKIVISLKNAKGSGYGNYFLNNIFHFHFLRIDFNGKQIYSHKHKNTYMLEENKLLKKVNKYKIDRKLRIKINNYYSYKNLIIKSVLLIFSDIIVFPSKIIRKLMKL
mgnify:CR=1 FL=1